jgi:NAD(P)-dependent dehydrogenase (short-subunit alcohol dehydrogenase family)
LVDAGDRPLATRLADGILAAGDRVVTTAGRPAAPAAPHEDRLVVVPGIADPFTARDAIDASLDAFGRLDVVVSTTSAPAPSIADGALDELRAYVDTGFWRALHLARAALPVMRAQGAGHIVHVAAEPGPTGHPSPGASWLLGAWTDALAAEVAPFGVAVTLVPDGGPTAAGSLLRGIAGRRRRPPRTVRATAAGDVPGDATLADAIGACRLRCENYAR